MSHYSGCFQGHRLSISRSTSLCSSSEQIEFEAQFLTPLPLRFFEAPHYKDCAFIRKGTGWPEVIGDEEEKRLWRDNEHFKIWSYMQLLSLLRILMVVRVNNMQMRDSNHFCYSLIFQFIFWKDSCQKTGVKDGCVVGVCEQIR
ncbi:hypothetical protein CDAR_416521 [Caerostris darwini]|uniref:Uncharacterized protein n=1 Tax=Caerostris darwini TaxID=1538125 RepID=A0AAV4U1A8_9ARAC|nr:hypothetical protein CDAR_416521 [Caerostris darwini]